MMVSRMVSKKRLCKAAAEAETLLSRGGGADASEPLRVICGQWPVPSFIDKPSALRLQGNNRIGKVTIMVQ